MTIIQMTCEDLVQELSKSIGLSLAKDLVGSFVELRKDCKTGTLDRTSAGKFVETVVQVLQYLESASFDSKPQVDEYLRNLESRSSSLSDDLKICCSRITRSCYTIRNKRNIAHKGLIDPNVYDLNYTYAAAQWTLSEIVRHVIKTDMATAGKIIEFIQIPISSVVERFGSRRLVYGALTVAEELLVLLHSYYPDFVSIGMIQKCMDRRSKTGISNALKKLWDTKLVYKEDSNYVLTQPGFVSAVEVLNKISGV